MIAIVSGTMWLLGLAFVPETYVLLLLRKRTQALSLISSKVYRTKADVYGKEVGWQALSTALVRPWILLFKEPIVSVLSIYIAIIYGTLYILFSAFPICFQEAHGWTKGTGSLAFLGVAVGMIVATMLVLLGNKRYLQTVAQHGSIAPPEARLKSATVGTVVIPVGLFWFTWTNRPSIY